MAATVHPGAVSWPAGCNPADPARPSSPSCRGPALAFLPHHSDQPQFEGFFFLLKGSASRLPLGHPRLLHTPPGNFTQALGSPGLEGEAFPVSPSVQAPSPLSFSPGTCCWGPLALHASLTLLSSTSLSFLSLELPVPHRAMGPLLILLLQFSFS